MQVQVIFANKEECVKRKVSQTTITEVPDDIMATLTLEEILEYLELKFGLQVQQWTQINARTNC